MHDLRVRTRPGVLRNRLGRDLRLDRKLLDEDSDAQPDAPPRHFSLRQVGDVLVCQREETGAWPSHESRPGSPVAWLTTVSQHLAARWSDEPTAQWIAESLGKPIIDNYWQTETGWPILTICNGIEPAPSKFGSPGKAVYGYDVKLVNESTGEEMKGADEKGVVMIEGPLPPGCMQTVWQDDARFVKTYWTQANGRWLYSTFDWGIRDQDGYYFILGRTDDVINVAGHRLGTREIEESISSHPNVAEVAVVGVADNLKGQVAMAFAIPKDASGLDDPAARLKLEGEIMKLVDRDLGAVARPARVRFVTVLPKTRSGKLLRRALQAVAERRDPGDLTTMDDPAALQQVKDLVG